MGLRDADKGDAPLSIKSLCGENPFTTGRYSAVRSLIEEDCPSQIRVLDASKLEDA